MLLIHEVAYLALRADVDMAAAAFVAAAVNCAFAKVCML